MGAQEPASVGSQNMSAINSLHELKKPRSSPKKRYRQRRQCMHQPQLIIRSNCSRINSYRFHEYKVPVCRFYGHANNSHGSLKDTFQRSKDSRNVETFGRETATTSPGWENVLGISAYHPPPFYCSSSASELLPSSNPSRQQLESISATFPEFESFN